MRILGIDYGSKRIGLAISDPKEIMAQPLKIIERTDNFSAINSIIEVISDYDIDKIVVGIPITMAGELGPQAKEVINFAEELKKSVTIPVETWDERLTTASAERALIESQIKRKKRKKIVDKVAAAILLQGYLDSKRSEEK